MRVPIVLAVVLAAALFLVPTLAWAEDAPLAGEWLKYRDRFVGDDGRVRDTGNKDVSHTEGQGWGMLFAEACDDRASFDRIWQWTHDKLQQPNSALFSWRWDPHDKNPIADANNATDGDMLIAWALARAARRWHSPDYSAAAQRIVADIQEKLIVRSAGRLVLLPGGAGFTAKDGTITLNPSYYIFPAMEEFHRLDGSALWTRLRYDGVALLAKARFGEWKLTPDWISVDKAGKVTPAANQPPRFGFDAIRIPLYLIWGRVATSDMLSAEMKFWNGFADKLVPAWVDVTNGSVVPCAAPSGFQAIIELVRARLNAKPSAPPQIGDSDDYYSASLILLSSLARHATGY
jgi:endoglucanase